MAATVVEHRIGDVRWTVVRGPREAAFSELGAYAAADIRTVLAGLPEWPVTGRARRSPVLFRAIESASQVEHPDAYAELAALASGAGVPFDDLLLANLRGDLGTGDGTGCTDLAWVGARSLLGHNEDGAPVFDGIGRLLTLLIDGEPGVCVWWYPGFVPTNTFTLTTHGLVWGIDSVNVVTPSPCAGRHFVARSLQRAVDVADAVSSLRSHASAGGFAYTMGQVGSAACDGGREGLPRDGRDHCGQWAFLAHQPLPPAAAGPRRGGRGEPGPRRGLRSPVTGRPGRGVAGGHVDERRAPRRGRRRPAADVEHAGHGPGRRHGDPHPAWRRTPAGPGRRPRGRQRRRRREWLLGF